MTNITIGRRTLLAGLAGGIVAAAETAACGPILSGDEASVLDLADFGVSPSASPQANLAGLKAALAKAPAGATLRLRPTAPLACRVDTSGGWSRAATIARPVTLRIDGDLQSTHGGIRPDPSFMLNVTAPGVTISGSGRILGHGVIDDTNGGTDETMPGLVRVAADDFTLTGVEIVASPKVGVMLYQCRRARIVDARFSGGPRVYGDTGYFAIRAAGGGGHLFRGNRFYPAADGGMYVQCIMLSGSHDNLFAGNHALHPYEKLVYGFGDRNMARDNVVVGNPGYVPGTNIQGTITAVFRFHGSFNTVRDNYTRDCAGGAQMMDGSGHMVINNQFLSCGQSAISAYRGDLSESMFRGNVGTRAAMTGFVVGDGMRLISTRAARGIVVEDNRISDFSVADPIAMVPIWRGHAPFGRNSVVKPSGAGNGRFYAARGGGVSGTREPRWPTAPGATVIDGSVIWVAVAYEGGQAEIKLEGAGATAPITDSSILRNTIDGGQYGIVARFVARSRIIGNRIAATQWAMIDDAGNHNSWKDNEVRGAAAREVRNVSASSLALSGR